MIANFFLSNPNYSGIIGEKGSGTCPPKAIGITPLKPGNLNPASLDHVVLGVLLSYEATIFQ